MGSKIDKTLISVLKKWIAKEYDRVSNTEPLGKLQGEKETLPTEVQHIQMKTIQQKDGINCGPYVVLNAYLIMKMIERMSRLTLAWTQSSVQKIYNDFIHNLFPVEKKKAASGSEVTDKTFVDKQLVDICKDIFSLCELSAGPTRKGEIGMLPTKVC